MFLLCLYFKDMNVSLAGDSKLRGGVNVSVNVSLSVCVSFCWPSDKLEAYPGCTPPLAQLQLE
ncbi:hypothetical protein EXN66_Car012715 [Channa argus]|uniref:Uncharacterized protein n=1 Tax=Channa argus TaxID=215402 RepID=A0A6G1Q3C7_CHAAH|nr:hypothetical protein EXN66_Car012715 [Channa argus]